MLNRKRRRKTYVLKKAAGAFLFRVVFRAEICQVFSLPVAFQVPTHHLHAGVAGRTEHAGEITQPGSVLVSGPKLLSYRLIAWISQYARTRFRLRANTTARLQRGVVNLSDK